MRPIRSLAAAVALAAGAVAFVAPAIDAAPPSDDPPTAAAYGARWLAAGVTDAGFVAGPGGAPAIAATVNVAAALAATGVETGTLDDIVEWMRSDVDAVVASAGTDDPGRIGLILVVLDATGDDPRAFGGVDLVDRLDASLGGFAPGLYGAADPTFDGVYRQSLALIGLVAVGAAPPATAVDWLLDQQCTGAPATATGGWISYRPDTAVPCVAPDPDSFVGPDTNQTALALEALAALEVAPAADPVPFLASAQTSDGGFAYYPGQSADPNSTALVIQGLLAAGEDIGEWAVDGGGPLSSLLSWQLGCDAPAADVGAFASPYSDGFPDALATQQAVPAAALRSFPLGAVVPVPTPTPCEVPSTTTSSVPASSTTSTSTVSTSSTTGPTSTSSAAPATAAPIRSAAGTPAFAG